MRYSAIFPKTRREEPKDANSVGTGLLMRAGFVHKVGAGIWSWTHMGLCVRRKCEEVVRGEMNKTGAVEVELPILQPREFWDETARWEKYKRAGIAFALRDRRGQEYLLAPTAEELVVEYARAYITSHRDLPITLWQMGPKFRDELRPRQGVVRAREFLMKDAYSFGATEEQMRQAYQAMCTAYRAVFNRAGFDFIQVEADSGSIGGSGSAEFMAITNAGEDVLLHCHSCGYGANQEKASASFLYTEETASLLQKIPTPNIRTVEELEKALGIPARKMVKTIVMLADGKPVVVSMRGDLAINEIKLANLLGVTEVGTADARTVIEITGAPVGFAGPIGLFVVDKKFEGQDVQYFFDRSVEGMKNFLCGGNEEDVHYINVNAGRDFLAPNQYLDLSVATAGLQCPRCDGVLASAHGIELGHVFQLQQTYSASMKAVFKDELGKEVPFWMGCYGIGVSRMVQAIVEQRHDERGIMWPAQLAPYHVVIVPAGVKFLSQATEVYDKLASVAGLEVMLDDRGERFGVAMTDAELIGYPIQVIVGKRFVEDGKLEVRYRDGKSEPRLVDLEVLLCLVRDFVPVVQSPK